MMHCAKTAISVIRYISLIIITLKILRGKANVGEELI